MSEFHMTVEVIVTFEQQRNQFWLRNAAESYRIYLLMDIQERFLR